jgi:glycosyltransferase involved in cell wall biosynthesis
MQQTYSILMPVYAGERASNIRECLQSIERQVLRPEQVVIVEDGPIPDDLAAELDSWAPRLPIDRVRRREHAGLAAALNAGLAACRNELVGRMDADDIALDGRFRDQIAHLAEDRALDVLGGQIEEFREAGASTRPVRKVPASHAEIRRVALFRNPMNHMAVCFRRSKILKIGGYQHRPGMEDYDLWLRGLRDGLRFENLPVTVVRARTNRSFYERRRGLTYARQELALGAMKLKLGLWPPVGVAAVTAIRALSRLLPAGGIELVYSRFLRGT